jgi:hypothetical protein
MKSIRIATCVLALSGALSTAALAQQQPASRAVQMTEAQLAQVVASGYGSIYRFQSDTVVTLADQGDGNGAAFLKTVGKVTVCRSCSGL